MKNIGIGISLWLLLCGIQGLSAQAKEVAADDTVRMMWEACAGQKMTFTFSGGTDGVFVVDWGDGDTNIYSGGGFDTIKPEHTYKTSGMFDVWLYNEPFIPEISALGHGSYVETAFGMNLLMVAVEGGSFEMGTTPEQDRELSAFGHGRVHTVVLDGFYIGAFEVTQAQWEAVMGTTVEQQRDKSSSRKLPGVGDNYPMYYVNWEEANEFCRKLSEKTGKTYRLPTEAEWEYAARGGRYKDSTKYAGSNIRDNVAWAQANRYDPDNGGDGSMHEVGLKQPNGLGLYDMSGNVSEWCSDFGGHGDYFSYPQYNPQGPVNGGLYPEHVNRGGGIAFRNNLTDYYRVSCRDGAGSDLRYYSIGFRVVCVP